jgi:hypothetical protein
VKVNLGHTGAGYLPEHRGWNLAILANPLLFNNTHPIARSLYSGHRFISLVYLFYDCAERKDRHAAFQNETLLAVEAVDEDYTRTEKFGGC